jgi:hypothetical protein
LGAEVNILHPQGGLSPGPGQLKKKKEEKAGKGKLGLFIP